MPSVEQKRELLRFKQEHTELEYEAEIDARTEAAKKNATYANLQKLTQQNVKAKAPVKAASKRRKVAESDEDEDDVRVIA